MGKRSVNGFPSFEPPPNLGIGTDVSAGIALSGCAGIVQISALLARVLGKREQAVFQHLREWYLDAKQKSGKKRRELDVTRCFAPRLALGLTLVARRKQTSGVGD
jgi:hypothetical protein